MRTVCEINGLFLVFIGACNKKGHILRIALIKSDEVIPCPISRTTC